jgi:hypothetical protein
MAGHGFKTDESIIPSIITRITAFLQNTCAIVASLKNARVMKNELLLNIAPGEWH